MLLSETTTALPFPSDAPFLFASMAFGLECLSVTHEAARNQGLESQCNLLLAYIAGLCAVSSGTTAFASSGAAPLIVDVETSSGCD